MGLLGGLSVVSCAGASENGYWQGGAAYELQIMVYERPIRMPGIPAPMADSMRLFLTVDSVRGDSLFGKYEGPLDSLGILLRDDDTMMPQMVGRVWADSFAILLDPAFLDGHLAFSGVLQEDVGRGLWRQMSPAAPAGAFALRKVP